jgi:hypothetical protein
MLRWTKRLLIPNLERKAKQLLQDRQRLRTRAPCENRSRFDIDDKLTKSVNLSSTDSPNITIGNEGKACTQGAVRSLADQDTAELVARLKIARLKLPNLDDCFHRHPVNRQRLHSAPPSSKWDPTIDN